MDIEIIKPLSERFTLEDAFSSMYSTVIPLESEYEALSLEEIGVILGVMDTESEIELVIRFADDVRLYTKEQFERELKVYEEQ
ncbi:MAG: hypothetical protein HWE39_24690 [Oceanospirillaceae bacterium]|nr:hypothetical protein [Oceanospirillaceae bacterium]